MRFDTNAGRYTPLWNKYRPVILKMMIDAAHEPQQYKLMRHEFQALSNDKKLSLGFNLHVHQRKAVNSIKNSEAARDLLSMLELSRKGSELTDAHTFHILLDKEFILHVSKAQ